MSLGLFDSTGHARAGGGCEYIRGVTGRGRRRPSIFAALSRREFVVQGNVAVARAVGSGAAYGTGRRVVGHPNARLGKSLIEKVSQ